MSCSNVSMRGLTAPVSDLMRLCSVPRLALTILLAIFAFQTGPFVVSRAAAQEATDRVPSFAEIREIMSVRCVVCHSVTPTQRGYIEPANGVAFDTPEQIKAKTKDIYDWAILSKLMPFYNETNMTDEERALLANWLKAGADITK